MLSFNNNQLLKDEAVQLAQQHVTAGLLARGSYDTCSVGCFAKDLDPSRSDHHAVVAEHLCLPEWLIHLQDWIFENIKNPEAFHLEFYKSIPVGINMVDVLHKISADRMQRLIDLIQAQTADSYTEAVLSSLREVRNLHDLKVPADDERWSIAHANAASAARAARVDWAASAFGAKQEFESLLKAFK